MAKKDGSTVVNETNGKELKVIRKYSDERIQAMLRDAIQRVKTGNWATLINWDYVEDVLACFDNNDDYLIEEIGDMFFICNPSRESQKSYNKQVRLFERFKEGFKKGVIVDL